MMQTARRGVSSFTSSLTPASFVNKSGYRFRARKRISAITRPIISEASVATTKENLAVLGWAAPSSFDTLTLHASANEFKLKYHAALSTSFDVCVCVCLCVKC